MKKSNRQKLLDKEWKRHSIFTVNDGNADSIFVESPEIIQQQLLIENSLIIITTYDCAVVSGCFESEPWVQLLVATPVEYQKRYAEGRDPRILHFKILDSKGIELDYQVNAAGICQINRKHLLNYLPDTNRELTPKNKFALITWISERYRQETWPDAFNNAINSARQRLKKYWKRYNQYISAAYLKLDTYQEKQNGNYVVSIIIAIEDGKLRELVKLIRCRKGHENKNIDEVKDIIIVELQNSFGDTVIFEKDPTNTRKIAIEVREEGDVTLGILRNYYKFSPHSLSEFDSDNPIPVEVLSTNKT